MLPGVNNRHVLGQDNRPELADIGRLARRLMARTVAVARAEEHSVSRLLAEHLAGDAAGLPVATGSWPPYDQGARSASRHPQRADPGAARRHRRRGGLRALGRAVQHRGTTPGL